MVQIATVDPMGQTASFFIKWTPRAIAAGIGGYYGLGLAYETGLMALVDRVSMYVIKKWFGTVGVGALMPTLQWHSSSAVRCLIGLAAGMIYNLIEKLVLKSLNIRKDVGWIA